MEYPHEAPEDAVRTVGRSGILPGDDEGEAGGCDSHASSSKQGRVGVSGFGGVFLHPFQIHLPYTSVEQPAGNDACGNDIDKSVNVDSHK